jgi:hypothetical protein
MKNSCKILGTIIILIFVSGCQFFSGTKYKNIEDNPPFSCKYSECPFEQCLDYRIEMSNLCALRNGIIFINLFVKNKLPDTIVWHSPLNFIHHYPQLNFMKSNYLEIAMRNRSVYDWYDKDTLFPFQYKSYELEIRIKEWYPNVNKTPGTYRFSLDYCSYLQINKMVYSLDTSNTLCFFSGFDKLKRVANLFDKPTSNEITFTVE